MLKALLSVLIWVTIPSAIAQVSPQVKPQPRPQIEGSPFNTQQRDTNQTPPQPVLTPQQIAQAIADGIATAAKKYEANHPPQPPDNSGWWVNFFLAIFTGALVVVAAAQCYIIFWTLKATQDAAEAATLSAQAAIGLELPKLFVTKIELEPLANQNAASEIRKIIVTITNYGRTPAFLTHESAEYFFGQPLPATPDYPNTIDLEPGTIIEKGDRYIITARGRDNRAGFNKATLLTPTILFWVYGHIWYRDFLNNPHALGFCSRLYVSNELAGDPRFIQGGPSAYTESY